MLVLSRRSDQKVILPSVPAVIKVISAHHGAVRLGIEAPPDVPVLREELYESGPDVRRAPAVPAPGPLTLPAGVKARMNSLVARLALLRLELERAEPGVRRLLDGLEGEAQALRGLLAGAEEDLPEPNVAVG
jgi:carbon storage regulator CsrA